MVENRSSNDRRPADTRALEVAAEAKGAVAAVASAVEANAAAVRDLTRRVEQATEQNSREHRENGSRLQQMEHRLLDRLDAAVRDFHAAVEKVDAKRSDDAKRAHDRIDGVLATTLKVVVGLLIAVFLGLGGWALTTLATLS